MDLADIERLLEVFARASLEELELSKDGWRIRLARSRSRRPAGAERGQGAAEFVASNNSGVRQDAPEAHTIVAGLVGTFYRRPSPEKPPFVVEGDLVQDGQTLGLIEAMKTLIPVEADRHGRVGEILKDDGAPVEPGQPLFTLALAGEP